MTNGAHSLTALGPVEPMRAQVAVLLDGGFVELLTTVPEPEVAVLIEDAVPAAPVAPPAVQASAPVKGSLPDIYSSHAGWPR